MSDPRLSARRVFVRGLRLDIEIGVHLHEHGRVQPVVVDVEIDVEPGPVRLLADTVNYEAVVERARAIASEGHVMLVETFADRLAAALFDDPRVFRVRLSAGKPEALAAADCAGVEVVLERARGGG
jgi:7,8-dihydroneopterin aldolase/epimerase/oxygenase